MLERYGLLPDEWGALPWYHQRSLMEELGETMEREQMERRELFKAIGLAAGGFDVPDYVPASASAPTGPSVQLTADMLRDQGFRVVEGA